MPTLTKCVKASGYVGATVAKVDNAPSNKLILKGKTPVAFLAALSSERVKRDLVREVKSEHFPAGLTEAGAFQLYYNGLTKPLPERYIHGYLTMPVGGICILTCVPYLLKLLDDPGVIAFDGDSTYKRIAGSMNEWELTVFVKAVLRATSVVRAYINRASAKSFEDMFDEVQRVKLMVTGKPMPLKRFVPGGNLQVVNADMDASQVLGICTSVMKHNVPEYSGISNDTLPEKVAPYFIKICWRHSKEPVHDFRSLVSSTDYERLLDFVYIDSKQNLDSFSAFVQRLGVKKIQDWWAHKEMHEWIISCLVKSQSLIPADVWDSTLSTTNTNETQHHWTNTRTGIKLPVVEAIESAYVVDQQVADEIESSLRTGILTNLHNEVAHRMARNSSRQFKIAQKAPRRQSSARSKDLNEQLKALVWTGEDRAGESGSCPIPATSTVLVDRTPAVHTSALEFTSDNLLSSIIFPVLRVQGDPSQPLTPWSNDMHTTANVSFDPPQLHGSNFNTIQPMSQDSINSWYNPAFYSEAFMQPLLPSESGISPAYAESLPGVAGTTASDSLSLNFTPFQLDAFFDLNASLDAGPSYGTPADPPFARLSQYLAHESEPFNLDSSSFPSLRLPPPQPRSPSELSSVFDDFLTADFAPSGAPTIRRDKLDGLDPANILASGSSRSREPTARKRLAEEEASSSAQAKKKPRSRKIVRCGAIASQTDGHEGHTENLKEHEGAGAAGLKDEKMDGPKVFTGAGSDIPLDIANDRAAHDPMHKNASAAQRERFAQFVHGKIQEAMLDRHLLQEAAMKFMDDQKWSLTHGGFRVPRSSTEYPGIKFKKDFLLEEALTIKTSSTADIDRYFTPEMLQNAPDALAWVGSGGKTNDSTFRKMRSARFKEHLKEDHRDHRKSDKESSRGKVRRRRSPSGSRGEGPSRKYRRSSCSPSIDEHRDRSGRRKVGRKERVTSEELD
ncbi:hypothetical protein DFH09DRAFT_1495357 [Mycena vulgaris]|nr:hypothetical protein DFH09DRAFT_1495357 [Mycena vulgaris]